MKYFKNVLSAILLITAISLSACSNASGGSSAPKTSKYQVGDIVLNDGSYLRGATSVSDTDKAKAIAVIYKVSGATAYGVGLVHNRTGLAWCLNTANAYNKNITAIQCTASGTAGNLTFTDDTDGSNNLAQIGTFLASNSSTDDTSDATKYPAFYFAKKYKDQANTHVTGTVYESGWYLPTISELFDIWKVKTTVDAASNLCGGSQFEGSYYWSSAQSANTNKSASTLAFNVGYWFNYGKENGTYYVCCIRAFN